MANNDLDKAKKQSIILKIVTVLLIIIFFPIYILIKIYAGKNGGNNQST